MKIIKTVKQLAKLYAIFKAVQHYKKYFPIIVAVGKRLYKKTA